MDLDGALDVTGAGVAGEPVEAGKVGGELGMGAELVDQAPAQLAVQRRGRIQQLLEVLRRQPQGPRPQALAAAIAARDLDRGDQPTPVPVRRK